MKPAREAEIAFLIEEWRLLQFGSERYMGELKAVGIDMGIPDVEMKEFCLNVFVRRMRKLQQKEAGNV